MNQDRIKPRLELLAPAGDLEAMHTAVANGADAVYFGLPDFNARRRAANFTLEALSETVDFLHRHNVRAYVTFNTLIFPSELARAAEYAAAIAASGADAVIVQDLGLAQLIHRLVPTLPLHASTQSTLTENRGLDFVWRLGVERTILARELSLDDIRTITASLKKDHGGARPAVPHGTEPPRPMELEVFVHGALCISFSGQCLASRALLDRSANRGLCAQACRLPYEVVIKDDVEPASEKVYPLSPHDLATWDLIGDLVRAGVTGFKIEGRLKDAGYVAAATRVYRAALDAALAGRAFVPSKEQLEELALSFSRGFCHGFLDGPEHQKLVEGRSAGKRGLLVGTVVDKTHRGIVVELGGGAAGGGAIDLKPGDGLVFGEDAPNEEGQGGRVFSVEPYSSKKDAAPQAHAWARPLTTRPAPAASPPRRVELTFGRDDLDLDQVEVGAAVWKTDDPKLRRRLEVTWSRDLVPRPLPVDARVLATVGEPLGVVLRDEAGNEVAVTSAKPLELAAKHPLTADLAHEQLGRLGDTPFVLRSVELAAARGDGLADPVMAPKSVLNDLRREAVAKLLEVRAAKSRHAVADAEASSRPPQEIGQRFAKKTEPATAVPQLAVLVHSWDQLQAVVAWQHGGTRPAVAHQVDSATGVGLVYCDLDGEERLSEAVGAVRAAGLAVGLATPRIIKPGDERLLEKIAAAKPDVVLVRNLAALEYFGGHGAATNNNGRTGINPVPTKANGNNDAATIYRGPTTANGIALVGDFSLNAANEITAALLLESGLARLTPSQDLTWEQVAEMLSFIPAALLEPLVYQHVPLFHMEHCLFAANLSSGTNPNSCGRPCGRLAMRLRDRNGEEHPVRADAACRNTVFCSRAQSSERLLPAMVRAGVRHVRLELVDESADNTRRLLETFGGVLGEAVADRG